MDSADPGPADGEERMADLRPRTRSNPEGAEDRRNSNGGLNSPPPTQPTVGSRVEGEGEAASTDSPPSSTSTITTAIPAAIAAAATTSASGMANPVPASLATAKERPKPSQPSLAPQIPPASELHLRAPRVNCPEKVIICLDLTEEMSLQKLESFNG
ncbi:BRISC and BRCA1-A complex member 1 [Bagarius yarrelli]|uniref:BRISC and BRCA1-A complex member 1 n=1 Tax=Bagarius yarrelli TaxID=175774 RepID=A0A556U5P2_BAGYA|nr:BRISC and BRCA1-A complex member 1 [Bagarius yarrelli]